MKHAKRNSSSPKREHRTFHNVEVRATGEKGPNGRPVIELRAITPGVVDDYGTVWLPDVFDEAIAARTAADPHDTPSLCWAHRWDDPIGHGIRYTPDAGGPLIAFELDDFDAVPRAKQADAQVRSKTVRDCSVGFVGLRRRAPTDEEKVRWPGVLEVMEKGDLDETSLVLRGAVPGAKVTSIRSAAGGVVDLDAVVEIARRKVAGELSDDEAKAALELLGSQVDDDGAGGDGSPPPALDDEAAAALEADVDAALDVLGGGAGRSRG